MKENGISRQYAFSTPKNCSATQRDECTHHTKKMFASCMQPDLFLLPFEQQQVPTVTAFAPFPIIYILLRGVTNSWVDTDTPSTACHTHRLPGAPSEQGSTKKSLQPAIIHSSTQLVLLYKLPAVLIENYLSPFTKAKKPLRHSTK